MRGHYPTRLGLREYTSARESDQRRVEELDEINRLLLFVASDEASFSMSPILWPRAPKLIPPPIASNCLTRMGRYAY